MSRLPDHARIKKFHRKNRGGCSRCRQRHVRCDQVHPRCLACTRLSLHCEWPLPLPPVISIAQDANDLRSFQYYREITMSEMQGYHADGFWNGDLLRLSHSNRNMEQLVIALSSLDEAFRLRTRPESADLASARMAFSVSRYQSAIEGLRSTMHEDIDVGLVLTSCVVCACIELWHGALQPARGHVEAGYAVAVAYGSSDQPKVISLSNTALPILWRLGRQLAVDSDGARLLDMFRTTEITEILQERPRIYDFEDTTFARKAFYATVRAYACRTKMNPVSKSEASSFLLHLDEWYKQFKTLGKKRQSDMRGYHLLATHYFAIRATVDAVVNNDECLYDNHLSDFEGIIIHSHSIMALQQHVNGKAINSGRSADASLMMALALVAFKCRSPLLRRSALRLLYRCRRLEGPFGAVIVGVPAEQLMRLEEETCTTEELQKYEVPVNIRRLTLGHYNYMPGLLEDDERQDIFENWSDDPPSMDFEYSPCNGSDVIGTFKIQLQPFASRALGFGMKSIFWYPVSHPGNRTIYDEEIPLPTRSLEGPHLGNEGFSGRFKNDLQSILCMQYITVFEAFDLEESTIPCEDYIELQAEQAWLDDVRSQTNGAFDRKDKLPN